MVLVSIELERDRLSVAREVVQRKGLVDLVFAAVRGFQIVRTSQQDIDPAPLPADLQRAILAREGQRDLHVTVGGRPAHAVLVDEFVLNVGAQY
ncbi:MAG: hypothetical protein R6X02_25100 [Enhygromyxa sp.]